MKKRRSSTTTGSAKAPASPVSPARRRSAPAAAPATKNSSNSPAVTTTHRPASDQPRWTFLTNHAHVLVMLSQNPAITLREVARQVGITERAVQHILAELEKAGILQRTRVGRQNRYQIENSVPLRHPIESHRTIGELLQLCARSESFSECDRRF
ncbi:MAG: helix-turn-helix transcriptional regulator [Planctomycetaceae bacterium]